LCPSYALINMVCMHMKSYELDRVWHINIDMNVFMIMSMHTNVFDNCVRSNCLCILLVSNYVYACHLLHNVYILYWRKGPGWTRGVEGEYLLYCMYWRKGPGWTKLNRRCRRGVFIILYVLEEGTGLNRRYWRGVFIILYVLEEGTGLIGGVKKEYLLYCMY